MMESTYIYQTVMYVYMSHVQYYFDVNEVESWLKEKVPLVFSQNYDRDEASFMRHF